MTRARDRLFLFSSARRNGYGKILSRFLEPLLGSTIERRRATSPAARSLDEGNDFAGEQLDRLRV